MNAPVSPSGEPWWADRSGDDHRLPVARGAGSRRGFGSTWWGRAWVHALQDRARLDPNRLARGRSYARRGAVGRLKIAPGLVLASVQGSRPVPYTVTVQVPVFSGADWNRVLDAVGAKIGRTAALLDGELPPDVVDDVTSTGLDLLPGAGEVEPRCSCPDAANPCKHSAAVCYLVADRLDDDPFALLLLRGRSRGEVLSELRARRTTAPGPPDARLADDPGEGVLAGEAYASTADRSGSGAGADLDPPAPPLPPARPGRPVDLRLRPPAESGVDADDLTALAADAAVRAWQLATGDGDGGLALSADDDLARRAEPLLGTPALDRLAKGAGVPPRELTGWAIAWRHAGAGGLAALRDAWTPGADVMSEASVAVAEMTGGEGVHVRRNRLTVGKRQVRLGEDGRWYPFLRSFGGWDLAGPPAPDPRGALDTCRGLSGGPQ